MGDPVASVTQRDSVQWATLTPGQQETMGDDNASPSTDPPCPTNREVRGVRLAYPDRNRMFYP